MKLFSAFRSTLVASALLALGALFVPAAIRADEAAPGKNVPVVAPQTPAAAAPAAPTAAPGQPQVKLTPEQETKAREMQMQMVQMQFEQVKLGLQMSQIQLQKGSLELAMTKQAMIRINASDAMSGVYRFTEEVNKTSVAKACVELDMLVRELDQVDQYNAQMTGKKEAVLSPITIIINSPGGSVVDGLALYDSIRALSKESGHKVTVKVRGMAASMGGILLQAGDKRVISKYSRVLIHEVSSGTYGKVSEQKDQLAVSEAMWDQLVEILAEKSKVSADKIRENGRKDWILTAKQAVELGFADEIEGN